MLQMINLKSLLDYVRKKSGDVISDKNAKMTKDQVCQIAKDWALNLNLIFDGPIEIKYRYFDEGNYWIVKSNALGKCGTIVKIDDQSRNLADSKTFLR
ncbi:MAG: hypothetical protein MI799_02820 [Desulfobacterales bacterium]|nr:hypothetical protein [Desulfobacterales bacterium]